MITHILRVRDVSVEGVVEKYVYVHAESKMSILSESKSTITHRLGAKDVSIE